MHTFFTVGSSHVFFIIIITFKIAFSLNIGIVHYFDADTTTFHDIEKRETNICSENEFFCKSEEKCVSGVVVCDGIEDCNDKSDETLEICKNTKCPSHYFRCAYGACIELSGKCNGRKDCADNSDETHIDCPKFNSNITTTCRSIETKCNNGQCISEEKLCDGRTDCNDGSDETILQCYNWNCPRSLFRCEYGACIDAQLKCDGTAHCVDGSDESDTTCFSKPPVPVKVPPRIPGTTFSKPISTVSSKPPINVSGLCTIPPMGTDKYYLVHDIGDNLVNFEPGTKVPKNYKLSYTCNSGYFLENINATTVVTFCTEGGWNVEIKNCKRMCPPLQVVNMGLACFNEENHETSCPSKFLSGAKIRPYCETWFHPNNVVNYRYVKCQNNGEWDQALFTCVADCGKSSPTKLIYKGKETVSGDSPWHVAIYNTEQKPFLLICGGTIISQLLVVSAAHCFYDEVQSTPLDEKNYEVVVSKFTRDYNVMDNKQQKVYKIKRIVYSSNKVYYPTSSNHASDIVVLVLQNVITITQWVLPACVSWSDASPFNPGEDTPGKLVGWGVNEAGGTTGSNVLLAAELPFISYSRCVLKVINIDFDKFCAGSDNGAGARQGDSGGGLLFLNKAGLLFLRGVVSTRDKYSNNSIATFTDLTYHTDWIHNLFQDTEKEILKMKTVIGSKS